MSNPSMTAPGSKAAPSGKGATLATIYERAKADKARAERAAVDLENDRPDVPGIASHWRAQVGSCDALIREIEAKYPEILGAQP